MAKSEFINALLTVTKTRAEIAKNVAFKSDPEGRDRLLFLGKAMAYDEMTELLGNIDSLQQEMWKPSYEQMKALEVAGKTFASFKELNMNTQRAWKIFHEPLESLGNDLAKLMKL